MYAMPQDVAGHLGRPLSPDESTQVAKWIEWLESDIHRKLPVAPVDSTLAQRAIVESVAHYMRNPDGAISVSFQVDDGLTSKRYAAATGRVELLPHFWAELGLNDASGAFTVRPYGEPDGRRCWSSTDAWR